MNKLVIALWLSTVATLSYAACTTQTISTPDGKYMVCTTCCNGPNCNTTCF